MKPILFNTEMVRAILDGRKTVTRRIIKPQPKSPMVLHRGIWQETKAGQNGLRIFAPPYCPGDVLYVRETWGKTADLPGISEEDTVYAADFSDRELVHLKDRQFRWRPSIHMPKACARVFLRVGKVEAQPLQSITADECCAEGIWPLFGGPVAGRKEYYLDKFEDLWDRTIPADQRDIYGWKANPWVWVIHFEMCGKPEEMCQQD